jgi:hypothetical protein
MGGCGPIGGPMGGFGPTGQAGGHGADACGECNDFDAGVDLCIRCEDERAPQQVNP